VERYTPTVLIQDLHKAAHMGPLIVTGQIHIHVYLGNGLLLSLVFIKDGNRISDPFYTNLINVYISIIFMILDIFHDLYLFGLFQRPR